MNPPSEQLVKLAGKRAEELNVEVRWLHTATPQRPSMLVVVNPDEPPPLDKFEINVEEAGGWWRAAEQAGLIELKPGMKFEDFEERLPCGLRPSELKTLASETPERHLVMREVDATEFFLIEQAETRFEHTGNAVLWHKSRVFNANAESIGMSKQRSTRLVDIAEVAQVEANVCRCGQPLYMAPTERSATCPACGTHVANAGFVGQGRNDERRDAVRAAAQATQRLGDKLRQPVVRDPFDKEGKARLGTVQGPDGQTFYFSDPSQ